MKKTGQLISIVIPVYNCSAFIKELHNRLTKTLSSFCNDYEIIFINDGSPQNEWEIISEIAQMDKRVKGINFTKNFGQHYAITAGLSYASGDWFVVMDGDLQDPPEEIVNLFAETSKGYDLVYARRMRRKDTFLKVMTAKLFYLTLKYLSGIKMDSKIANFGIYSKKVAEEFNKMNEFSRSFPSLIQYLGFNYGTIDIEHQRRPDNNTSYTYFKMFSLAGNILLSNSNKPLKITIVIGFIMSALSFLFAAYNVIAKLMGFNVVQGYTSTIFSIWFVGGLILFIFGIMGLYIGKIFDQVKNRQLYVVSDKVNI